MPTRVKILCPDCKHRQHCMTMHDWYGNRHHRITFSCDKCPFSETRDGSEWMGLVGNHRDKNGC